MPTQVGGGEDDPVGQRIVIGDDPLRICLLLPADVGKGLALDVRHRTEGACGRAFVEDGDGAVTRKQPTDELNRSGIVPIGRNNHSAVLVRWKETFGDPRRLQRRTELAVVAGVRHPVGWERGVLVLGLQSSVLVLQNAQRD